MNATINIRASIKIGTKKIKDLESFQIKNGEK
jgi:hypothetical protein